MQKTLLAVGLNVAGPLLFLAVLSVGLNEYHATSREIGYRDVFEACSVLIENDATLRSECEELLTYGQLRFLAWLTLIVGVIAPLFVAIIPRLLGSNRVLLANAFPPLFSLMILVTIALMIGAAIWTILAAHIFMAYTIGVIWYYAYVGLGLAFLSTLYRSFRSALRSFRSSQTVQFAALVRPDDVPIVDEIIRELTLSIKVPKPKNVIIGAEPTFFVTNSNITLFPNNKTIRGETLYISSALLRLLSKNEIKAIIAHELMHYKGEDLTYTKRFAPIYHTLHSFVEELSQANNLFTLPFLANLSALEDGFSRSERRISREREFEADKGAAAATSSSDLITALVKVSVFAHLWDNVLFDNARAQEQGEFIAEVGQSLLGYAVYACDATYIDALFDEIVKQRIPHPTDTHPSLALRAENVGVDLSEVKMDYFDEFERDKHRNNRLLGKRLNDQVTNAFHALTILRHNPQTPDANDKAAEAERIIYRVIYQIAEHFIRADGKIIPAEVRRAEELGIEYFPKFNPLLFRELLHSSDQPVRAYELASLTAQVFTDSGIDSVKHFAQEIIAADDDISQEEKTLYRAFFKQVNKIAREIESGVPSNESQGVHDHIEAATG